jgi:hypothetical protein
MKTLDDSGEGSLRQAMEVPGPRIRVFRASGAITLKSAIRVSAPYFHNRALARVNSYVGSSVATPTTTTRRASGPSSNSRSTW